MSRTLRLLSPNSAAQQSRRPPELSLTNEASPATPSSKGLCSPLAAPTSPNQTSPKSIGIAMRAQVSQTHTTPKNLVPSIVLTAPESPAAGSALRTPRVLRKGKAARRISVQPDTVVNFESGQSLPEATKQGDPDWQMRCADLKARVSSLFNCFTMSDVIFQIESHSIPAHKFVLASASPVFHTQLYEHAASGVGMRLGSLHCSNKNFVDTGQNLVQIEDVPHLAFFEFLRFLYTDGVHLSLENVLPLIFLADTYRVDGLSGRCFDYVRSAILPSSVLRVLAILRTLLLKAMVSTWRDQVEHAKNLANFRALTLAQRRARLEELAERSSVRSAVSRRLSQGSVRSFSARSWAKSRASGRSSRASMASWASGETPGMDGEYKDRDEDFIVDDEASIDDLLRKSAPKSSTGFTGQMVDLKLAAYVEELSKRCWKCIQEDTERVFACPEMLQQDVKALRGLLKIKTSSVPEICFFRAAHGWATKQCQARGLEPTAKNKRDVLGEDTIVLLRFPAMSLEEFSWEVVPSGILEYEDVRQLLSTMSSRKSSELLKYNSKPRSFKVLRSSSQVDAPKTKQDEMQISRVPYKKDPNCHLDAILEAELMRIFLKKTVRATEPPEILADKLGDSSVGTGPGLLPAIVRDCEGSLRSPAGPGPPTGVGSAFSHVGRISDRRMILGLQIDPSEWGSKAAAPEARHDGVDPKDLQRLAPGLYRFRKLRVVEIWLERGEAMARDHGDNTRLESCQAELELHDLDGRSVRAALGLPEGPPLGRGVPLAAFLRNG